jgi:sugar phosphate isomerase/epimerase
MQRIFFMDFSIASYSFHRLLRDGKQDMFKYITDSKDLGCAYLDPWNGHLAPLVQESDAIKTNANPIQDTFSDAGLAYAARVKAAVEAAGLPVSCLAIDGAHIYEPTPEARAINRSAAWRWLEIAQKLGAEQIRIDSGGDVALTEEQFDIVVEGLKDVVKRASDMGITVGIENHWGGSKRADNVVRMLKAVDGLTLLFDSCNFPKEEWDYSWDLCAPYARSVHIKAFEFDAAGNDPTVDIPRVVRILVEAGYKNCWGIESVPRDGDEYGAVKKTMALIQRSVEAL